MSGPTEFGELPREDQLFWNAWFEEAKDRIAEQSNADEGESVKVPVSFLGNL